MTSEVDTYIRTIELGGRSFAIEWSSSGRPCGYCSFGMVGRGGGEMSSPMSSTLLSSFSLIFGHL